MWWIYIDFLVAFFYGSTATLLLQCNKVAGVPIAKSKALKKGQSELQCFLKSKWSLTVAFKR